MIGCEPNGIQNYLVINNGIMKKYKIKIIVFWLAIVWSSSLVSQTFEGTAILFSQNDIDQFGANNYKEIIGEIFIGVPEGETDITDFSPLNSIEQVINDEEDASSITILNIQNHGSEFNGFEGLIKTKGRIVITAVNFEHINGFQNLRTVEGDLLLSANNSLKSINGFNSLDTVVGDLSIAFNPELLYVEGFQSMEQHYFGLNFPKEIGIDFTDNPKLVHFNGFRNLKKVHIVSISGNEALENLNGLCSIEECLDYGTTEGGIVARNNPNLTDCYAVCGLPLIQNGQDIAGGIGDCFNAIDLDQACAVNPSLSTCEQTLSFEKFDISHLKIGPNPLQEYLSITGFEKNLEIRISDLYGRIITNETYKNPINISDFERGAYVLQLSSSQNQQPHAMIIIKK